jgi:hypothetical protein
MKMISPLVFMSVLFFLAPVNSSAATLENLPSAETTKNWKVVVGEPDTNNPKLNKSTNPDLYNIFSLDIKHVRDEKIKLVKVEAYREEPKLNTEYELFTAELNKEKYSSNNFHFQNFGLSKKSSYLKVVVTWTKEDDHTNRKYREEFIFQQ